MQAIARLDWGVNAAFGLVKRHFWVVCLTSLPTIFLYFFQFTQTTDFEGVLKWASSATTTVYSAFACTYLVFLFLRDQGAEVVNKSLGLAMCVALGLATASMAWSAVPSFIQSKLGQGASQFSFLAPPIIFLISVSYFIGAFYTFCAVPQVMRDGKFIIRKAVSGIKNRGMLWIGLTIGVISITYPLLFLIAHIFQSPSETGPLKSTVFLISTMLGFFQYLGLSFFTALSVVWLLNPRVKSPEESTTWIVPSDVAVT